MYVDNTLESPAVLSLCTGMRGLERGIERAIGPVRTVAYVEIEAFIIENLVQQMEQGVLAPAPVWSNLKTFPSEQFHGKIHGITGGYPCQPFSVAGQQKGTEDPRHLWPYIFDIVRTVRPVWCFFENVPGHITLGYREVRSQLQSLGYKIEQGIFSAEEAGAPHQRKRLFILAVVNTESGWSGGLQDETGKRKGYGASRTGGVLHGKELADTEKFGMERNWSKGEQKSDSHEREGLPVRESGGDRWPSNAGQDQYEWEAPRVESSVGFTVNGYNYREDLLRMAGNGVVEQTAQLAWITLWNKFK